MRGAVGLQIRPNGGGGVTAVYGEEDSLRDGIVGLNKCPGAGICVGAGGWLFICKRPGVYPGRCAASPAATGVQCGHIRSRGLVDGFGCSPDAFGQVDKCALQPVPLLSRETDGFLVSVDAV